MNKLVAEYERLREIENQLIVQMNTIDTRLVEIERQLPKGYIYSGDVPLDSQDRSVERG